MESHREHGKIVVPELILISGAGQNTGKTTLATSIIRMLSGKVVVNGIKTSPHFHSVSDDLNIIRDQRPDYMILRENQSDTGKDSARMLQAGCKEVFLIFAHDRKIQYAFRWLYKHYPHKGVWICESPALAGKITPGLFFFMDRSMNSEQNRKATDVHRDQKVYTFFSESLDAQTGTLEKIVWNWIEQS